MPKSVGEAGGVGDNEKRGGMWAHFLMIDHLPFSHGNISAPSTSPSHTWINPTTWSSLLNLTFVIHTSALCLSVSTYIFLLTLEPEVWLFIFILRLITSPSSLSEPFVILDHSGGRGGEAGYRDHIITTSKSLHSSGWA